MDYICLRRRSYALRVFTGLLLCLGTRVSVADEVKAEDVDFFTTEVLPVLKENCFQCHAGGKIKGGLRLSNRADLLHGGDSGPAVDLEQPGKSLLLDAINYQGYEMPPKGKLPAEKIEILTKWIQNGAAYSADMLTAEQHAAEGGPPPVNEETMSWWSFQKVQRPDVPKVQNGDWSKRPIDAFVFARLAKNDLKPNPTADRAVLIRRVYYDLLGLPPTPEQVEQFLTDESDNAWEKLIDRLLESPHYGEKWGRHWLDVVRYAESNSYERDGAKPFVWRYRDYVIRAMNSDKPYDRFILEQLAGDELDEATAETMIATGYYRLGLWQDEPVSVKESLYNDLDDILVTTSEAFLGLTIGCARCHDHKIDPIPQRDYYRMVSFFRNVRRYGVRAYQTVLDASVSEVNQEAEQFEKDRQNAEHKGKLDHAERELKKIEDLVLRDLSNVEKEDFQDESNRIRLVESRVGGVIKRGQLNHYRHMFNRRRELREDPPSGLIHALVVKEHNRSAPETFVLVRGNAHVEGDKVEPGFPSVLAPPEPEIASPRDGVNSTGRRLALARWIASRNNPLTARVMVNRIWQHHFGRGIVRSTSDFGFQGAAPTHPGLLDWLAAEFMDGGWKIKRIHKLILMSRTYQLSSQRQDAGLTTDPSNELFWRYNMRRLVAEEVRDSILFVNGSLNADEMYGPSVYPVIAQEVLHGLSVPGSGWHTSPLEKQTRRSIYIHVKRSLPYPMLAAFDMADADKSCPVRFVTTQPTQALGMLNSEFIGQQARVFADFVKKQAPDDTKEQVQIALSRAMQRKPHEAEIERALALVKVLQEEDGASADHALQYLCLVALNLNEFLYLD